MNRMEQGGTTMTTTLDLPPPPPLLLPKVCQSIAVSKVPPQGSTTTNLSSSSPFNRATSWMKKDEKDETENRFTFVQPTDSVVPGFFFPFDFFKKTYTNMWLNQKQPNSNPKANQKMSITRYDHQTKQHD